MAKKKEAKMGAWKLAYADFVTAMMCFFMLMWLLNAVPSKKLQQVAMYFQPTFGTLNKSGGDSSGGASKKSHEKDDIDADGINSKGLIYGVPQSGTVNSEPKKKNELDELDSEALFSSLESQVNDSIKKDTSLSSYAGDVFFSKTSDGIEISILDNNKNEMFKSGSDELTPVANSLIVKIADAIKYIPNPIMISGYTEKNSGNSLDGQKWILSADRANTVRKTMQISGIQEEKFAKIVAYGDNALLANENANSSKNRRVSITLLTKWKNAQYNVPAVK